MRPPHPSRLSPTALLRGWEIGAHYGLSEWSIHIFSILFPDRAQERIEELTIAERDRQLLLLRESVFGKRLSSVAACPHCGSQVQLQFLTSDLCSLSSIGESTQSFEFNTENHIGSYRLPNCGDLVQLESVCQARHGDTESLRQTLARRCLLTIDGHQTDSPDGEISDEEISDEEISDGEISDGEIPDEVLAAVADGIADHDSEAHTELKVVGPECGHRWTPIFDIASYFWSELDAYCQRLLREVHLIASTYGWSEEEILALSNTRRNHYLELIGHG